MNMFDYESAFIFIDFNPLNSVTMLKILFDCVNRLSYDKT